MRLANSGVSELDFARFLSGSFCDETGPLRRGLLWFFDHRFVFDGVTVRADWPGYCILPAKANCSERR